MEQGRKTKMKVIDNGRLLYESPVRLLKSITPEMMSYFMAKHGVARDKESYKQWHPDHLDFKAIRDKDGAMTGHWVKERVGKHHVISFATFSEVSNPAFMVILHRTPLYQWRTFSWREFTPEGVVMRGVHIVGSDGLIWGRFWNFITRKFLFTEELREAHDIHADEEFANQEALIKKAWAEREGAGS